jgi:PPOX class probable F420-dependent enzyme
VAELSESAVALIESNAHAHVATINPDGSPQVTVVWAGVDDGEIVVACLTDRQKLRNVRRDPRVSVSWVSEEADATGLNYYLVVRGRGRVTEGGAPELLARLRHHFLQPEVRFPRGEAYPGYVLRIAPERVLGYGPWAGNA